MSDTPYSGPQDGRLRARLLQPTLAAAIRLHRAYLALNPTHRLDDLYRPLLTKLAKDLERQCIAKGINPKELSTRCSPLVDRKPDTVPTHIRKKKSPTYDEM